MASIRPFYLTKYLRVIASTFEMTFRQTVKDAFILFAVLFQPLIIAMLALWMLKDKGSQYIIFVVIGSGMTGLWSSLLFISGNGITVERWMGTLESLVAAPTPIQVVVIGKNLANVLQSLGSMVVSYILVSFIFGYPLSIAQPWLFLISLIITVVSFVCFGIIIASLFILNPDVQRWQNGLEFPVYILCGFLFPIALLPGWTTPLSYLLTPYWAALALHASAQGTGTIANISFAWGVMLGYSILYLFLSKRLFRVILKKARVDATLSMH